MKRITIRLAQQHYEVLSALAQELGTDITGAARALISGHQRTRQLLDALDEAKRDILRAVTTSREATTENLQRTVHHISQLFKENST